MKLHGVLSGILASANKVTKQHERPEASLLKHAYAQIYIIYIYIYIKPLFNQERKLTEITISFSGAS